MLTEDGFNFMLNKVEFVHAVCPNGDIKAEAEEFLSTNLELVTELLGILDGGVGFWVTNFTLLCLEVNISFELGNLLAEVFHNNGGIDWINIH